MDKRTDIWAFGAVLYEMLTGRRAFAGDDVSDVLASVLAREPDWAALPARPPAGARLVIKRCLQRDRKQRFRDIGDVSLALKGAFDSRRGAGGTAAPVSRSAVATSGSDGRVPLRSPDRDTALPHGAAGPPPSRDR